MDQITNRLTNFMRLCLISVALSSDTDGIASDNSRGNSSTCATSGEGENILCYNILHVLHCAQCHICY